MRAGPGAGGGLGEPAGHPALSHTHWQAGAGEGTCPTSHDKAALSPGAGAHRSCLATYHKREPRRRPHLVHAGHRGPHPPAQVPKGSQELEALGGWPGVLWVTWMRARVSAILTCSLGPRKLTGWEKNTQEQISQGHHPQPESSWTPELCVQLPKGRGSPDPAASGVLDCPRVTSTPQKQAPRVGPTRGGRPMGEGSGTSISPHQSSALGGAAPPHGGAPIATPAKRTPTPGSQDRKPTGGERDSSRAPQHPPNLIQV